MKQSRLLVLPEGVEAVTAGTSRGEFAALVARPADGVPVRGAGLFVPGWTGSKDDFVAVLPTLARAGWVVAAYDQRGQYESAGYQEAEEYTWTNLAADAAALADWLTPGRPVHLVGHSFGGLVSAAAVVGHPSTWASATFLCSGPAGKADAESQAGLGYLAGSLETMPEDPSERAAGMGLLWDVKRRIEVASGAGSASEEVEAFRRRRFLTNDPAGLAAFTRLLGSAPDRVDDVARTEVAAFVVYGEDDAAWPVELRDRMAARLGSAPVVIADAGHAPAVEQPETTADVLAGLWGSAAGDVPSGNDPAA